MDFSNNKNFSYFSHSNKTISTPRHNGCNDTKSKQKGKCSWYIEIAFIVISLVTFLFDTATDILVGIEYLQKGELVWGSLTVVFVCVPLLITQVISACWYYADKQTCGLPCIIFHIFSLQPLERYMTVLVAGIEAKHTQKEDDVANYHYQMNDVCMLRLFEAFLESAPQLTLQLYVICCTQSATWLTALCACVSMLSIGWAVTSYSHALRQAYRHHYSIIWPGLLLQTFWHMCMAASRVLCLVAFAAVFKAWLFLVLGVHWLVMTVWIMLQRTDFCPSNLQERLFNAIVGVIYCFSFFNLKEGRSRFRMLTFYAIMFTENAVLLVVWYIYSDDAAWYNQTVLIGVPAGFVIGLFFMLIYYRFFHPSGPIYLFVTESSGCETPKMTHRANHIKPQAVSPVELPRRSNLLKQSSTHLPFIAFKEVATPSQLSPIHPFPTRRQHHSHPHLYTDCSFYLSNSSDYQHYSVDASACLEQLMGSQQHPSLQHQTNTMRNFDGITLSSESDASSSSSSLSSLPFPNPPSDCSSQEDDSPPVLQPESPVIPSSDLTLDSISSSSLSPPGSLTQIDISIENPAERLYHSLPRVKVVYVDDLHPTDGISGLERSFSCRAYDPPNASIRFIDATDTETLDSDAEALNMSEIHMKYMRNSAWAKSLRS